MVTEDGLIILIARIEKLASTNATLREIADRNKRNGAQWMRAQEDVRRLTKDMRAAEEKIAEWLTYAGNLTRLISPRRRNEIPPLPKPLETEIPF